MEAIVHPIEGTQYRVVDARGYRLLMTNDNDAFVISMMALPSSDTLMTPYAEAMLMPLGLIPEVRDIVLIGLGGGQQAKFVHNRLPGTRLTAVEIDADMVRIARSHFNLPDNDERLNVVVGDGGEYMCRHAGSCDLILSDGYDALFSMADSLDGMHFYRACHQALRPGGMMAINLLKDSSEWCVRRLPMLRELFALDIRIRLPAGQSVILLAKDPVPVPDSVLARRANALEPHLQLGLTGFIARYIKARRKSFWKRPRSFCIEGMEFGVERRLRQASQAAGSVH